MENNDVNFKKWDTFFNTKMIVDNTTIKTFDVGQTLPPISKVKGVKGNIVYTAIPRYDNYHNAFLWSVKITRISKDAPDIVLHDSDAVRTYFTTSDRAFKYAKDVYEEQLRKDTVTITIPLHIAERLRKVVDGSMTIAFNDEFIEQMRVVLKKLDKKIAKHYR